MNTRNPTIPAAYLDRRLQLLIEAVMDYGIFMLDVDGKVASWNSGAEKVQGYKREEILGRHFSIFYPPEAVAAGWPQEELRRARELGRFEDEGWRVRRDGTRFWSNVVITPLYEHTGELVGFAKVTRDLTERRRHEEELRASEQRQRLLVDSVRDYAIFMLDPHGIVQSWNSGAQAIKGYTAHEIVGRHFSVFFSPQDQASGKPDAELAAARQHGRVEEEGWRVRKDGSLFWANVVLTAIHGNAGELLGFAKVTRDMTERRRLEELESSSRRMNEFLAMLAHELRNPLAPIRNAVTVMQLETLTNPVLRNCRDVIDRQLTHVSRLVDDLLDVGRLTTGKIRLRKETLRLGDVALRSAEMVGPLMQTHRHTLHVALPPYPVYVEGDATRLCQVVQNLLTNSAKYTPDGGRIELKVEAGDGFVSVSVGDNGRGIDAADLDSIFRLFVQVESDSATSESGMGIGLTLARSLAELHGGTLDGFSEGPGRGSMFTLRLPAARRAIQAEESAFERAEEEGLRVLVVDDNRDSADTTTEIVRLLGNQVECAYDGPGALDLARRFRPAVVMLDLSMPGMDGFETRRQLRAQPGGERAFLVAVTGLGRDDDKRRTREAGFDAHLIKPLELEAIVSLLDAARQKLQANQPAG